MEYKRIYIIGATGSGKTFVAKELSQKFQIPNYDLDDIMWKDKYKKRWSMSKRRKEIKKIADEKRWIIEGVYGGWVNYALKKADVIIFLKINKILVIKRLIFRFLKRRNTKENVKDLFNLVKFSLRYQPKKQMDLVKKLNKNYFVLRKRKEIFKICCVE